MSSGYGHLACRWLALAVFCTGHGPLEFPAEVWRASRAFYTQAHNCPPLPACTYWQWHKYAPLGEHTQEHTYAHKYVSTEYILHILECTLALFSFTFCLHCTEYTHKLRKKADMKLKLATKSWNWPYLTSYQTGPIINQFLYLSYSSLSILCACSLSPSLYTIFFSATALHKHEKGSCSAISAIQATRDQGLNQKTISGLKNNNQLLWRADGRRLSQKALKISIQRRNEPCKWNLTARSWDTQKCCFCKVYKLDIFQTNVTSWRWQKWITEAGHIITVTSQIQSCLCLQLLELY